MTRDGLGIPRPALGARLVLGWRLSLARAAGPRLFPAHVREVMRTLAGHGFEAYAVGGAVRDLLLGRAPQDWDVATSAEPRYVMGVFVRTVPLGVRHGTVRVIASHGRHVDVTTYRVEGPYSDRRRPDHVRFTASLGEDLRRRDFTINALALGLDGRLRDPYRGLADLAAGIIRTVGDARERFGEDALRMYRAVRLSTQLNFSLDPSTAAAIRGQADLARALSVERVRDELERCLLGPAPDRALEGLRALGLLQPFLPELIEGVGLEQNDHHAYTVWEHTLRAVAETPPSLHLRLTALLHDIGKPRSLSIEDGRRHFYGHERVGAEMAGAILERLRYDKATVARITHLVRHHMVLQAQPGMKDAAVRRLINRVGPENIPDLIALKRADRKASGVHDSASALATAALIVRVERMLKLSGAFTVSDLAVDGGEVMRVGRVPPGPQVGFILKRLLEEVLEDPGLNRRERLQERIREIVRAGAPARESGTGRSEPGARPPDRPEGARR